MRGAHVALAALALLAAGGASAHTGDTAGRAPVTVKLGEFFFKPRVVTVHVGQAVRFVNVGKIDHTVAAPGTIKPRPLSHGDVQTVRFAKAGTIKYVCTFHPTLMRGSIRVVP